MERPPIAVIGGGLVGLATARALQERFPSIPILVLEKEADVGRHQSGHNSGVVHTGLYYRPGSLKARLCVEGRRRMLAYLRERSLPFEGCGKLVVATRREELPALDELQRRARANGIGDVDRLEGRALSEREPAAAGLAALWVPGTGITDYRQVAAEYRRDVEAAGGEVRTGRSVQGGTTHPGGAELATSEGPISARYVVNCGGLYSDRLARALGDRVPVSIVPFRGEYFVLRPDRSGLLRGLVYPVPDPALPFLGVHFTRTIDGRIEVGPNAVWAAAREGYRRTDVRLGEAAWAWTDPGFLRVVRRHLRTGLYETFRSIDRATFARDLGRLVPSIVPDDLLPGGAGVRAQAVRSDGTLCDDFVFQEGAAALHVLNAPSPGATASLAIGEHIAGRVPTFG